MAHRDIMMAQVDAPFNGHPTHAWGQAVSDEIKEGSHGLVHIEKLKHAVNGLLESVAISPAAHSNYLRQLEESRESRFLEVLRRHDDMIKQQSDDFENQRRRHQEALERQSEEFEKQRRQNEETIERQSKLITEMQKLTSRLQEAEANGVAKEPPAPMKAPPASPPAAAPYKAAPPQLGSPTPSQPMLLPSAQCPEREAQPESGTNRAFGFAFTTGGLSNALPAHATEAAPGDVSADDAMSTLQSQPAPHQPPPPHTPPPKGQQPAIPNAAAPSVHSESSSVPFKAAPTSVTEPKLQAPPLQEPPRYKQAPEGTPPAFKQPPQHPQPLPEATAPPAFKHPPSLPEAAATQVGVKAPPQLASQVPKPATFKQPPAEAQPYVGSTSYQPQTHIKEPP